MHWVKATTPTGEDVWVNLASIPTMMRAKDRTILYLGGVAMVTGDDGKPVPVWARTDVKETPEELFALPKVDPVVAAAMRTGFALGGRAAAAATAKAEAPTDERKVVTAAAKVMRDPKASKSTKIAAATALTQSNSRRNGRPA